MFAQAKASFLVSNPREQRICTIGEAFRVLKSRIFQVNEWTINDVAFSMDKPTPAFHLTQGRRYRLRMRNASDDIHPIHLHRHSFELTKLAGQSTAGVVKDVVMVGGYQEVEVDFTADNPGLTLFHCHQQLHMDFGFMALFEYI